MTRPSAPWVTFAVKPSPAKCSRPHVPRKLRKEMQTSRHRQILVTRPWPFLLRAYKTLRKPIDISPLAFPDRSNLTIASTQKPSQPLSGRVVCMEEEAPPLALCRFFIGPHPSYILHFPRQCYGVGSAPCGRKEPFLLLFPRFAASKRGRSKRTGLVEECGHGV